MNAGVDCGHASGASVYVREQPHPAVCFRSGLSATAAVCRVCGHKGVCLKLQPGAGHGVKAAADLRDGSLSGPVKTEFFDIAETTGEIPLYKRLVMADPKKVVKKALRDSMMGKTVSVYGALMKAFFVLAKIFPHDVILSLLFSERLSAKSR